MFVRLKNGDDIITECYEYQDDNGRYYVMMNPLKAVYMDSSRGPGYLQVAFMPWVYPKLSRTQEFTIGADEVLMVQETSEKMEEYYWDSIDQLTNQEPEKINASTRMDKIREALEELGLDGDLDISDKKVMH
jgi:hypothetical protein